MPAACEWPVGDCAQHQVGEFGEVDALRDGGQGALRGISVAHLDPLPEPAAEHLGRNRRALERIAIAPWRLAGAVGGDAPDAVEQGEVALAVRQLGETLPSATRMVMPMPKPSRMRAPNRAASRTSGLLDPGAARAEHRLGDHQTEIVAMPSSRRRRQCAAGSARRPQSAATKTWPSSIRTSAVGTSSAHRSKVPPLATSKRAWCQGQVARRP